MSLCEEREKKNLQIHTHMVTQLVALAHLKVSSQESALSLEGPFTLLCYLDLFTPYCSSAATGFLVFRWCTRRMAYAARNRFTRGLKHFPLKRAQLLPVCAGQQAESALGCTIYSIESVGLAHHWHAQTNSTRDNPLVRHMDIKREYSQRSCRTGPLAPIHC